MPIVEVEIVRKPSEDLRDGVASELADGLGRIFDSPGGGTWVKVYGLAENIHVIYEPGTRGRVAFGGDLLL
ncbi:MAG TPA: hypothetical protein VFO91_12015 [Anaerolineales bacterium]|nr:hypothetical protein [Anaerolineales bacterium]